MRWYFADATVLYVENTVVVLGLYSGVVGSQCSGYDVGVILRGVKRLLDGYHKHMPVGWRVW
jgi:hypothetical protein